MSGRPTLRGRRQEAFLALMVAHDALQRRTQEFMKGFGLTVHHYNVLRILRGAGDDGHQCQEIGARMVTRVPDVTRLVDRLEQRGLVERRRCERDRRVVYVRIKKPALDLLAQLDAPVAAMPERFFAGLAAKDLRTLNQLLVKARPDHA
ncbi:MAG: MarR family transcriptional regulator [Planctomycetes bacterium]|nr:MarR family transcriptional regulator [Planctomycetota bacterium]